MTRGMVEECEHDDKSEWKWGPEQLAAWRDLQSALQSDHVLRLPDIGRLFMIHSDANGVGIGAALMQRDPDAKGEDVYLGMREFEVHTDHQPLLM